MAKRQRGDVRVASRVIGKGTGHLLGRTLPGELGPAVRQWVWRGTMLTSVSLVTVFLVWAGRWQRRLHQLMGIDEPPEWPILGVLILAAVVLTLLVLAGRALRHATRIVAGHLHPWVPLPVAALSGAALVAVLAIGVINDVFLRAAFGIADRVYQAVNEVIAEELAPPGSCLRSGGPGSLVTWERLQTTGAPVHRRAQPIEELRRIGDEEATRPIPVYTGVSRPLPNDLNEGVLERPLFPVADAILSPRVVFSLNPAPLGLAS